MEHAPSNTMLHHLGRIYDDNLITNVRHNTQVVGDHDHGFFVHFSKFLHQAPALEPEWSHPELLWAHPLLSALGCISRH
jgi:hypothetical protein